MVDINWDLTDTDIPYYNELLKNPEYFAREKGVKGRIVYITYEEYMLMAANIHDVPVSREYQALMPLYFKKYADDMKKGDKFPIPVIDKYIREQEGRHRVAAAAWIGAMAIPVLVVEGI